MSEYANAALFLRRAGGVVLDVLLPPRCLSCGVVVDRQGTICPGCWSELAFLSEPLCACCGYPFAFDPGPEAECGACAQGRPAFGRARAVLAYDDLSRGLVLGLKHGDRTHLAPALGVLMARAGAELLGHGEIIVPVPLHRRRLWRRRYNQASLLALAVGRAGGLPMAPDALVRRKPTASLGHMSPSARRRALRGAFAVPKNRRQQIIGKRVILVDDVLTTGATAEACARCLKRAGAATVELLVFARVVRGSQPWEG
ncbi:MAG: double zinc ribbon domain-containing protein [Alphaproteobacteria bacterium]